MTKIKIKKARRKDTRKISLLRRKTLREINSKEYSKEILNYLLDWASVKGTLNDMKKREIFCAWKGDKLVGTVDFELKRNRIGGFFVKYNLIGKGVGSKLLEFIEDYAKKKEVKKLNLNPSSFAYNFYKNRRYNFIGEKKWAIKGCNKKLKIMEKKLK